MDNSQLTKISNLKSQISNDKGQVILILILVMTVALSIGLSIVQRSLVDVSTASKVEQSSRAFSAAEAGLEKVLSENPAVGIGATNSVNFTTDNQSQAQVSGIGLIPCTPGVVGCEQTAGHQQIALEFPPLAKEDTAQVWLADLNSASNPPSPFYKYSKSGQTSLERTSLDIYWGTAGITDPASKPAIEIKLVYLPKAAGSQYVSWTGYLDSNSSRITSNNFCDAATCNDPAVSSSCLSPSIITTVGLGRQFYCKSTIKEMNVTDNNLMLIRMRFLYSGTSQPFAVQPPSTATCGTDCSLPPQARSIISTGISGETQRKVKVFQLNKVVPPYFDYAIFSAGDITK